MAKKSKRRVRQVPSPKSLSRRKTDESDDLPMGSSSEEEKPIQKRPSRRKSLFRDISRWPFLIAILIFLFLDLISYILIKQLVFLYEYISRQFSRRRKYYQRRMSATCYKEWKDASEEFDDYCGFNQWKNEEGCDFCDVDLISKIVRRLKRYRKRYESKKSSLRDLALYETQQVLLHGPCKGNIGGIENEALYSQSFTGTKVLVQDYVDTVCDSLRDIGESDSLSLADKQLFFKKAFRLYGRTALCLSGGAIMGYYHIGVIKALMDEGILPKIMTGASAGSLVAAMCAVRTDEEIRKELFTPELADMLDVCAIGWKQRFSNLMNHGSMFIAESWRNTAKQLLKGEMTFLEAYKKTGRILNISVCPDEARAVSKQLNYITAPDVVINTAVFASSAIPGVVNPVELLMKTPDGNLVPFHGAGKKWRDGSLQADIPEKELHHLFNVNYTIVSQTNPHIVLFFYERNGSAGSPTAHRYGRGWRGGFLSSATIQYFKLDLQKWVYLIRDLELLPKIFGSDFSNLFLQKFEGSVTIVPPITWEDYMRLMSDPDRRLMSQYIKGGQEKTWAKMSMISNRLKIESLILEYRKTLGHSSKEESEPEYSE